MMLCRTLRVFVREVDNKTRIPELTYADNKEKEWHQNGADVAIPQYPAPIDLVVCYRIRSWSAFEDNRTHRDRIPQNAYPAPGTPPPASPPAQMDPNVPANPPVPGTMDKWERWGWGHWGRGSWPGQENANAGANPNDRWGWNFRHGGSGAPARPEGAWGPPMPSPHPQEPEKDVMQQAQETVSREHSHPTPLHPRREFVPCPRGACSFRD